MKNNVQLTHKDYKPSGNKFPLSIIANDINHPLNIGSLFRLCDALGLETLYLSGDTPLPPNSKIGKTSRSTEKHVNYDYHEKAEELVTSLKKEGVKIVSLEITSNSVPLNSPQLAALLKQKKNICLIVGAEKTGVSEALLSLSDITVHIPMSGNNSSMNVVSAASIACYQIIRLMQEA